MNLSQMQTSEGLDEHVHMDSLIRAFTAHLHKV